MAENAKAQSGPIGHQRLRRPVLAVFNFFTGSRQQRDGARPNSGHMTGCVRRRLVLFYENESGRRASPGRADRFGLKMNYCLGKIPPRVLAWLVGAALAASFLT